MLVAAGLIDLGFAAFHAAFWRLFGWPERLRASGGLNAAITQTLNAMLGFVFLAYGAALLLEARTGAPAMTLPLVGGLFWLLRLALQFLWFDMKPLASRMIAAVFALAALVHLLAALA
jgi:hypothetical protein